MFKERFKNPADSCRTQKNRGKPTQPRNLHVGELRLLRQRKQSVCLHHWQGRNAALLACIIQFIATHQHVHRNKLKMINRNWQTPKTSLWLKTNPIPGELRIYFVLHLFKLEMRFALPTAQGPGFRHVHTTFGHCCSGQIISEEQQHLHLWLSYPLVN
jgi:hypothetical protein